MLPDAIAAPDGFLGPFLNILPLVTIAFFIVHQKLFTPPPTDDQTKMQHQMMKFMMVFMGFIFFKVAAGLCIYIIASSAWGVAERLLLPKPSSSQDAKATDAPKQPSRPAPGKPSPSASGGGNGAHKPSAKRKKKSKGRR
jgi:YidC/Oxa1 family membrane protein insertase